MTGYEKTPFEFSKVLTSVTPISLGARKTCNLSNCSFNLSKKYWDGRCLSWIGSTEAAWLVQLINAPESSPGIQEVRQQNQTGQTFNNYKWKSLQNLQISLSNFPSSELYSENKCISSTQWQRFDYLDSWNKDLYKFKAYLCLFCESP